MIPTVHHILRQAPRGISAADVATAAGLSLVATYAELVRLEAIGAADMLSPHRHVWGAGAANATPKEAR